MNFGPNSGLVYCMEYLIDHIDELLDELNEYADDSFFLLDFPGQIEL